MQETPIISRLCRSNSHQWCNVRTCFYCYGVYANCCNSSKRTGAITGLEVCAAGAGLRPSKGHTCTIVVEIVSASSRLHALYVCLVLYSSSSRSFEVLLYGEAMNRTGAK